jgi:hypothetical protein
MGAGFTLRDATPADVPMVVHFVRALAEYENKSALPLPKSISNYPSSNRSKSTGATADSGIHGLNIKIHTCRSD